MDVTEAVQAVLPVAVANVPEGQDLQDVSPMPA